MAVLRWLAIALVAACTAASLDVAAQTPAPAQQPGQMQRGNFANPAEYDSYMTALNTQDPSRRATAMEVFIAWYPGSILRIDAYEQAIAAWQAAGGAIFVGDNRAASAADTAAAPVTCTSALSRFLSWSAASAS